MALQHLRSSTANKRPIPTQLSAGQIAVNTNEASPGLFFKDSNGDLVKIGPVHVGTSAPNSSPASTAATALVSGTVYQILTVGNTDFTAVGASANTVGVVFTATGAGTGTGTVSGQQGNEKGEQWLDTTGGAYDLKIYDGSAWRSSAGEFVNASGDNMTGNLTLGTDKVVLNASSGAGTFAGKVVVGNDPGVTGRPIGTRIASGGNLQLSRAAGDQAIAIYKNGTDSAQIELNTDGSAYFASNVGIGTTSPGNILHISSADPRLRITDTSGTTSNLQADILFQAGSGGSAVAQIGYTNNDDVLRIKTTGAKPVVIGTNDAERLRIDSSGNVGIGESSPISYDPGARQLVVKGSTNAGITIRSATNKSGSLYFADGTTGNEAYRGRIEYNHTDDKLQLGTAGTGSKVVIDSSGNVGINTVSPSAKLEVDGQAYFTDRIICGDATSGTQAIKIPYSGTATAQINVDGSAYFASNVGIGTSSPTSRLHLYQTGSTQAGLIETDQSASVFNFKSTGQTAGQPQVGCAASDLILNTDGSERMRIDSSGNIAIGSTTTGSYTGYTTLRINNNTNGGVLELSNNNTIKGQFFYDGTLTRLRANLNTALSLDTNDTQRMRIDSSGRVGIGTPSPSYNLVVSGTGGVSSRTIATDAGGDASFFVQNDNGSIAGPLTYGTTKTAYGALGSGETAFYSNRSTTILADGGSSVIKFAAGGNTERMRIDSSGNVGIGTTSATSIGGYTGLSINNATNGGFVDLMSNGSQAFRLLTNGSQCNVESRAAIPVIFFTNTVERMRIDSSGRLGLGTSSPNVNLHLASTTSTTQKIESGAANAYSTLQFRNSGNKNSFVWQNGSSVTSYGGANALNIVNYDGPIAFAASSAGTYTERMRIDSSGKVGIGTTSASESLEVAGNGLKVSGQTSSVTDEGLTFDWDSGNNNGRIFSESAGSSNLLFYTTNSGTRGERLRIDSSGNLLFKQEAASNYPEQKLKWSNDSTTTNGFYISQDTSRNGRVWHEQGLDILFGTTNQERMRIDSSGNVAVGRTAASSRLDLQAASGRTQITLRNVGNTSDASTFVAAEAMTSGNADLIMAARHNVRFFSNLNEKMRVTSAGYLCVNRTDHVHGGQLSLDYTNGVTAGIALKDKQTTGTGVPMQIVNGAGSVVGSITQNQSSTSFNTSSDYRLKENVIDIADGITRVKQLQPKRFNFIADANTTVDGFLAHEAQTVVPEAVTGTHNEVDDDGNAVMQGIDQSKLVPLLTAALQEAIAKIETLEAKVTALEAG